MSDVFDIDALIKEAADRAVRLARAEEIRLVTVESCTGGRLAATLVEAEGASEVIAGGFITYTKEQKAAVGVLPEIIERDGVVSESVSRLMAEAGLKASAAEMAISLTGVAGPETDDENNSVGLLYVGIAKTGEPTRVVRRDYGPIEREVFMRKAVHDALTLMIEALN